MEAKVASSSDANRMLETAKSKKRRQTVEHMHQKALEALRLRMGAHDGDHVS